MNSKQQNTLIVGILACVLVLGAAFFFGVKPQLAKRSDYKDETVLAEQATAKLNTTLRSLEQKQGLLPQTEKRVADLFGQFPNSYEQDAWFAMVLQVAKSSGVGLGNVTAVEPVDPATLTVGGVAPSPAAVAPGTEAVAASFPIAASVISLEATGSAANLRRFVAALEKMKRPILVDELIYNHPKQGASGEPSVSITGKLFLARSLEVVDPAAPVTETPEP